MIPFSPRSWRLLCLVYRPGASPTPSKTKPNRTMLAQHNVTVKAKSRPNTSQPNPNQTNPTQQISNWTLRKLSQFFFQSLETCIYGNFTDLTFLVPSVFTQLITKSFNLLLATKSLYLLQTRPIRNSFLPDCRRLHSGRRFWGVRVGGKGLFRRGKEERHAVRDRVHRGQRKGPHRADLARRTGIRTGRL